MVYLHLCCEGWRAFGPFRHLTLLATAITDQEDRVVAFRDGGGSWRTPGIWINYAWRTPMVTATEDHPHPLLGKTERVCSMRSDD